MLMLLLLQVFQLESTFDIKRYLSSSERAGLAASLQLSETQVGEYKMPIQKCLRCTQCTIN